MLLLRNTARMPETAGLWWSMDLSTIIALLLAASLVALVVIAFYFFARRGRQSGKRASGARAAAAGELNSRSARMGCPCGLSRIVTSARNSVSGYLGILSPAHVRSSML
jgi:hypothetical protein